jgi:hypothetical protein
MLARDEETLAMFDTRDLFEVLNRMLDVDPPVEDLIAAIEPHMLH